MDSQSASIRPAAPTHEEGLVCARYLDTAAEGFFRVLLGRHAPEIIAQAYVQTNNEYSYENVFYAEREARIVGMAVGFTAKQRRAFPSNPLREARGYPQLRAGLLGLLMHSMIRILETVPEGDYYLLSLAVDGDQRGAGIGSALIRTIEERARETGSKRLSLDVGVKNLGAQRLYARHGLAIKSKWPKHLNLGSLGLYRMSKPL
jgi:ribosomal protein S18 acetylase RimI-like enzyme